MDHVTKSIEKIISKLDNDDKVADEELSYETLLEVSNLS